MEDENKSVAELEAEQAALLVDKTEEIKASIIEDLGLDEVEDADKIEKLVAKDLESRKNLATAIGQKIKHRTRAEEATAELAKLKANPPQPKVEDKKEDVDVDKKVNEGIQKALDKRDLEALEYPDDLKKEIRRVADIQGVSISAALKDPYIAARIDSYEKSVESDDAAISRKNKSASSKQFDPNSPPELDINDPASVKKYDEWFAQAEKKGE